MTMKDLAADLEALGQPGYRADQVGQWIYRRAATDFAAMTNLPADLRRALGERYVILTGTVADRRQTPDRTLKLLLAWSGGGRTETVLIPTPERQTACLSTQIGCAMGCTFCASGIGGLERNMTAGEIVEQVLQLQVAGGQRISHVVLMGTGEPLGNYDATVAAVRALIDPERLGISGRRITLSTVGVPAGIRRLAKEGIPLTLAISLHAPNDGLRRQIMPRAANIPLEEVISAAEEYFELTHRRLTLEYVILPGVNDTNVCAAALERIARRLGAQVNLIGYNPVPDLPYRRPTRQEVETFASRLERLGVNAQVRRSRGQAADAACGQLRRR